MLVGCATTTARESRRPNEAVGNERESVSNQTGFATWYSDSLAGRHTASGIPYNPSRSTAAHRTLPFGTRVRVIRTDTGSSTEVVVNDRGPFGNARRIIDLSHAAAEALHMLDAG